ncbi:MAG: ThiF family adenylyltransferase [Desulfovibrio sp.]|jgi:molybdopterin/thiamine biosynthesis adenylyltransferase|nr:ThiF family adenylyltransferase [Desulfovibrio sp.]
MERMWDALVARQTGYVNFTSVTNAALADTPVAVVGTGGNGAVLDLLVRAGFMQFTIVDPDTVEPSNLNRLPFYPEDAGAPKVACWKRHLQRLNPECTVEAHQRPVTRNDGPWLADVLSRVSILFLGTTDHEANLVAGRTCAELGLRMIIGPASSGSAIVTTFTHDNGLTLEGLGKFGTEGIPLQQVDYEALRQRHFTALAFPGRSKNYLPEVWEGIRSWTHPARSCGIFVRLANSVMAFEGVKNAIDLKGLPLEGTGIVRIPEVQVFDPRTGCAYRYNALTGEIGIPDWLTGAVDWRPGPTRGGA